MNIKGVDRMARLSEVTCGMGMPINMYYNFDTHEVTENENGGDFVCTLINPNSPDDIRMAIRRWMSM